MSFKFLSFSFHTFLLYYFLLSFRKLHYSLFSKIFFFLCKIFLQIFFAFLFMKSLDRVRCEEYEKCFSLTANVSYFRGWNL